MINDLSKFGEVKENVLLKDYNTYKINSYADYLIEPFDSSSLKELINYLKSNKINYFVIGNGSNIILSDGQFKGVIIKLTHFNNIKIDDDLVYVEAGVMLPKLVRNLVDQGLVGLEWACAIPGTLGGSVVGNAGAYKEAIFDYITKVVILENNEIKTLDKKDIKYSYRDTSLKNKDLIVLGAYLKVNKGDKKEALEIIDRRIKKRLETQPLDYPSAGSVFRNPDNDFAGRIIEEDLHFKGKEIGGAKVSEKHANFIINFNNASGQDIRDLISLIKKEVKEKDNIDLVVEQQFIDWE